MITVGMAYWQAAVAGGLVLLAFLALIALGMREARGRDRAEEAAEEAEGNADHWWKVGYEDGYRDGLAARPEPEPWQEQASFYPGPPVEPEPAVDWRVTFAAEAQRWDDERLEWCQRNNIPFEDAEPVAA